MLKSETSGRFSWAVALTLVVLIVTAAGIFVFWRLETWPARTIGQGTEDLERLGNDLRSAFIDIAHLQPRITVNNRTIVDEAASPTAELAILTKQLKVKREFIHTWAGSSKRIKLSGTFLAKAGFDLEESPTWAKHAAWLRAGSGKIADALSAARRLVTLGDVEHVEPQMLTAVARKE